MEATSAKPRLGPSEISTIEESAYERISTGLKPVDDVLGGGLVKAEVLLISGEPGIGKSTLLLQIAHGCEGRVLYITGEETAGQVAQRAHRLGVAREGLQVFATCDLDRISKALEKGAPPKLIIIDSIQTVRSNAHAGAMGSVTQLREVTSWLVQQAKRSGIPHILVGHVTKSGDIAGPKSVEHLVDAVLSFEQDREGYRNLYSSKNRYGSTDLSARFVMEETGLKAVTEVTASTQRPEGCAYTIAMVNGGYRLGEVQALLEDGGQTPQRVFDGIDNSRGKRLVAIVQRYLGINLNDQNLYVSAEYDDPAADFAICAAIWSASIGKQLPLTAYSGLVQLTGEVKPARAWELRLETAEAYDLCYRAQEINQLHKGFFV